MRKLSISRNFGREWSPVSTDQAWLMAILAGAAFVFAMIVVFVVSRFTDIRISAWGVVGSIAPWYVAIMSGWIMYQQVPFFVMNGRTRRFGFRQWVITGAILAPLGAVLMGIGFLMERGIYNLAGWGYSGEKEQYFSGSGDLWVGVLQYLFTFAVWFALGGFIGVSLYRSEDWGWLSIPLAVAIVSVTGSWDHTGGGLFGVVRRFVPGINFESLGLDFTLTVVAVGLGVWLVWTMVRDLSMRNP